MSAWEDVLIEWCNCLDISKKIENFNELRNGDFFKNILYIINKSDKFKNEANVFKILLHILSQIYNNAQIEFSQYNSFLELSEDDLKIITSLLMHYTCIYDRRDILTSPLCHRLSKNTQVCIKSFLQKVDNEINYEDLENIIKELSVNDNNVSFKNNDKFHSPLMGILTTPVSKSSRFHEKDREFTKLKNMLELERYEKADLQEELRQQNEKIKKFELALNNSNSDIIRLKTQISALENRTPPHFKTTDIMDKEKRLKMDIQSLEHYIEKTEQEQDNLREEAYNSRKKLKEWELEYSNLHAKYLEYENKVEDLTKLSINQTNKISTLEAYCDELNGLLEEFQAKPSNESSVLEASTINVRRSLTLVEENLACSVVEVQLKDAQNENKELMMKIDSLNMQLDHNRKIMETKMNEYVARYNKLLQYTNKFTNIKTNIVDTKILYEKEMNEFSSYIEEIKQTLISVIVESYENSIEKLSVELTTEKEICQSLSNKLAASILSFEECNKDLERTLNEKNICQDNFAQLQIEVDNMNKKIQELSSNLNTSEDCNKRYSSKIDTLEEENVKNKYELDQLKEISQSLSDKLAASILKFEECNKDLENTLIEKNICQDNYTQLEKIVDNLSKKIQEVSSNLNTSEECNKNYLAKIGTLEKENVENKYELDQQKEISQSLSDKLAVSVINFEKCSKDLEKTLNEKNICLSNFTQLEKVVDHLNKNIQEISSNLDTSEECNKKYCAEIDRLIKENVKYKNEIDQQKEISQSLSDKLAASNLNFEECKKDLENTLNEKNISEDNFTQLEKVVDDLNKKIQEVSSNLETSEEFIKKYMTTIDSLEEENVKYKYELGQQKEISQSLSDKLAVSILNFEECNKNLEKTLNEKNICLANFAQLEKLVDDLKEKIQEISSNLNTSEDYNKKYLSKIDTLEEENVKYKYELDQEKEISQSLSDKLAASILNFEECTKDLEKTLKEKNISEDNFTQLKKVVDDVNKKIQDLSSNLNISEECNRKYSTKINTLEEENVKYKYELGQQKEISQTLSDKLAGSILNFEECNKDLEKILNEKNICLTNFAQLEKVVNDLNKNIQEISSNLSTSEECNKKYCAEIDRLKKENVKFKNEIDQQKEISKSLSDKLAASILNFEECNKNLEKTLDEKNICLDNFTQLEKVVDDLNKNIQEVSSNLNNSEECIKKYLTKIDTLEEENVKCKYELDQLENEKETHLLKFSSENREKDKLLNEKKVIEEDYINLITTIAMYNEELNKVVKSLKSQHPVAETSDFQNSLNSLNLSSELDISEKSKSGDKLDELNRLGEQISKINSYIHSYSQKETFYLNEIDNLKGELAASSTNYFDLAENLKEQNSDNEALITSLTENLHNIIEKYNHLQVEHREQLNRIKEYEMEITKLKKMHSDITLTNELKITNLQDEILKLEEETLSSKKTHIKMTEEHENTIKLLEDDLARSNEKVKFLQTELEKVTNDYNVKVNALEIKITLLEKEKIDVQGKLLHLRTEYASEIDNLQINILNKEKLITSLKEQCEDNETKISTMQVQIAMVKEELSQVKNRSGKTEEEYQSSLANLQVQVVAGKLEITKLLAKIDALMVEKEECDKQLKATEEERNKEIQAKTTVSYELEKEREFHEQLRNELSEKNALLSEVAQYTELQGKYEKLQQESLNQKFLEEKQIELQQKIETLMKSNEIQKETYEVFKIYFKEFRDKFDKLISQKNILERITNNLRVLVVSMNKNAPIESVHLKTLFEKKEAMEVITEDIMKQYNRCSKQMSDIVFDILNYYEKTCDDLLSTLDIQIQNYSEKYNLEELENQISDLTERTADALEQVKVLQKDLENLSQVENVKLQKENILGTSRQINIDKMKEDEIKKKNLMLRQKVTLLENAKNNLEKTVKKLREENKRIKEGCDKTAPTNDAHYNMLLQEYVAFKEKHNDILKENKMKLEQLQKEYEEHKEGCMRTSTPLGNEPDLQSEAEKYLVADLNNLREAYSSIRAIKAKLESENLFSKKLIEEQKEEISKFNFMKEAYDKLLEENSKLMTDVDTMKYKRTRDRDEFLRLLKKERTDSELRNSKQLQEIRNDYEGKLEKMKEKMIKLYREEVNKEMNKVKAGQHESTALLKIIEQLKGDLFEAEQKVQMMDADRDMLRKNRDQTNLRGSRESFSSLQLHDSDTRSLRDFPASSVVSSSRAFSSSSKPSIEFKHPSTYDARRQSEVRRVSTLPRTGTVVEEVTLTRRTSFGVPDSIGPNLHMEDEEEMFNNKYLADLKQGKCDLPASDDRDSRVSELAWRNSLVPPHLKSSYPAELQFCSPNRFKDDDIKTGNLPFDDSLCKLLPGEKPRKKDFGTTSYKKPGPPTPSKNGGRLSLQGNEVHPAREPPTEPKKSTPGRIRALFTGKNSSRSSTEVSPPKRRLNIFRR